MAAVICAVVFVAAAAVVVVVTVVARSTRSSDMTIGGGRNPGKGGDIEERDRDLKGEKGWRFEARKLIKR